jgi:hypothetical protein
MRERAESERADEHPAYDVESEPLPSHVYERTRPVYLWDGGGSGSLEELEAEAPHRAYVVETYWRMARLLEVFPRARDSNTMSAVARTVRRKRSAAAIILSRGLRITSLLRQGVSPHH